MVEEKKEEPEPLTLDKAEVRALLSQSGAAPERLHDFDSRYEEAAGSHAPILAANVINTRKFEIRTPDAVSYTHLDVYKRQDVLYPIKVHRIVEQDRQHAFCLPDLSLIHI